MSGLNRTPTHPTARVPHRCIACLHSIPAGEKYTQQEGYYEGRAYRNRYHTECFEALAVSGSFEFSPGEISPPDRLCPSRATGGKSET